MGTLGRLYVGCATVVFTLQLLLVLLLVAGSLNSGAWRPPFLASVAGPAVTPTATPTPDPRLAQQLAQKAQTATVPGTRFSLDIDQNELNSLLAQQTDLPVKNQAVALTPGKITFTAVGADPAGVPLEAVGTLLALDGRLRLVLQSGKAGGLPLPSAITALVENSANDALAQVTSQRNIYVETVEILQGRLRLSGRPLR